MSTIAYNKDMHKWRARIILAIGGGLVCLLLPSMPANASTSAHYQIQEDFVGGTGGGVNASSPSYQLSDAGGAAATGPMAGTAYAELAGTPTTNDPNLSFAVTSSNVSFGSLSSGATSTGTTTFQVLNYTSYGYVVQIFGNTPSNGSHNLTAMSGSTSATGTEQFGINLVANTSPAVGADPSQQPNGTFGFGAAASGYNTPNNFRYASGATIAQATKSSGVTNYTISYVTNVATTTPGGTYTGNFVLICVGTY